MSKYNTSEKCVINESGSGGTADEKNHTVNTLP